MLSIIFTIMEAMMAGKLIKRGATKWVAAIPVAAFLMAEVGLTALVMSAGMPLIMVLAGVFAIHGTAAGSLAMMLKNMPETEEAAA
ncbi:MAG: hypothetical protein AAF456_17970 [Planctomycetota bacterium]